MENSDITALSGLLLSGLVFIVLASRARITNFSLLGYSLANKEINGKQFGASFVAASTSLATVILFFLTTAEFYGITLVWCGATYLLGQYFFVRYVMHKDIIKEDVRTLSDLWFYTIRSKFNARWITALTVTSFLTILFVELYVGSVILSYFFKYITGYAKVAAFILTGLIVIFYVRIGGLKAVMQTDGWQLRMLILSVIALIAFSLIASPSNHVEAISFGSLFQFKSSWWGVMAFWLWILVLNFSLPFTQLSSWQRVAACKSGEEVWKGFKSHVFHFLLVWIVPVIAFVILSAKGYNYGVLDDLLNSLKSASGMAEGVLYPLIVIGFGSALFSTADTALIALITSFADTNTYKNRLEKMSEKKLKRTLTIISFIVVAILALIYGVAVANVGDWFMPLIYNIFGQLAILAPLMIYALHYLEKDPFHIKPAGNIILSISIVIAWLMILISTFLTYSTGDQLWSQLATPAGMLITSMGLVIALQLKKAA